MERHEENKKIARIDEISIDRYQFKKECFVWSNRIKCGFVIAYVKYNERNYLTWSDTHKRESKVIWSSEWSLIDKYDIVSDMTDYSDYEKIRTHLYNQKKKKRITYSIGGRSTGFASCSTYGVDYGDFC